MAQHSLIGSPTRYPENLGQCNYWNCDLNEYGRRLDAHSNDLFSDEDTAKLQVLQLHSNPPAFKWKIASTDDELRDLLNEYDGTSQGPKCQHFFLWARNSQRPLQSTESMAQRLFSNKKIMPVFIDFILPFRKSMDKKNFDFAGFRARDSWIDTPLSPQSAATSTPRPPKWPWSMRQTAVYHSFDLNNGDAIWINLKGSTPISPRIGNLTQRFAPSDPAHITDASGAFRATLATHASYCEWSSKNWAAYVGFLEDRLQYKTRYALLANVPKPGSTEEIDAIARTQTEPVRVPRRSSTMSTIARVSKKSIAKLWHGGSTAGPMVVQPSIAEETEMVNRGEDKQVEEVEDDFTYNDLRELQYIEDQANMTVLAIRSNINIISDLLGYYNILQKSEEFERTIGNTCDSPMKRFCSQVGSILSDLRLHQSRVETLLQLLADRKALLLRLLEHRNMSTNKALTLQAQESAKTMENLTSHMRLIALKTEKETIFMRIITVVTLFFLPGTFVAVSRLFNIRSAMAALIPQTLMSTDIMKFQNDNDNISRFSWQALVMYMGITLPVMGITLWAAFRYRRREQEKLNEKRGKSGSSDLESGLSSDT